MTEPEFKNDRQRQIVELWQSGCSQSAIARETGAHFETVASTLRRFFRTETVTRGQRTVQEVTRQRRADTL
jgi:DNA-binding CsgD family transcriptional regulator